MVRGRGVVIKTSCEALQEHFEEIYNDYSKSQEHQN